MESTELLQHLTSLIEAHKNQEAINFLKMRKELSYIVNLTIPKRNANAEHPLFTAVRCRNYTLLKEIPRYLYIAPFVWTQVFAYALENSDVAAYNILHTTRSNEMRRGFEDLIQSFFKV